MVHDWFEAHKNRKDRVWLLVIDDAGLPEVDLCPYTPRVLNGDVILTTQRRVPGSPWDLWVVAVTPLAAGDAVNLLLDRARKMDQESRDRDRPLATEICGLLGYVPLAVEHAGALIAVKGMECFREMFRANPTTILQRPQRASAHPESVFRTFQVSFGALAERNLEAAKLLVFLAFLDNTAISPEFFFDENGVPKTSLRHMSPFQTTKAKIYEAVAELDALALISCEGHGAGRRLLLQPLVYRMTRDRLSAVNLATWTMYAAQYLCAPILQAPTRAVQLPLSNFKHVLQVLQQAAELEDPKPLTDTFLRLWRLVALLLQHYYHAWLAQGKAAQLERYCQRCVDALGQSSEQDQPLSLLCAAPVVMIMSEVTRYTKTPDTAEGVYKKFLAKHLRPEAAMALECAARRDGARLEPGLEPVRYWWAHKPATLRAVLKSNTWSFALPTMSIFFRHLALRCAGDKRWHEALVLAQFSELPASLWPALLMPSAIPPVSPLVAAAYHASFGLEGVNECLGVLTNVVNGSYEEFFFGTAAHDASRILLKQRRFRNAETQMRSTLNKIHADEPAFSVATVNENLYPWTVKALVLALVGQGRTAEAGEELAKAHAKIQNTIDDDTLPMLHIEMLLPFFHRKYGVAILMPPEEYDERVAARFKRMYAANRDDLLKAEGLNMAIILLEQGAHDEAVAVLELFIAESSEPLRDEQGLEHELTLRARGFLQRAQDEMKKERENEANNDLWFHFGSALFQRDATRLDGGRQGLGPLGEADEVGISWVTEDSKKARGVWDKLETMLADVGVLPLPSLPGMRWIMPLMRSRWFQVLSLVVLVISVVLVSLYGW
jgi:hypothetical protein